MSTKTSNGTGRDLPAIEWVPYLPKPDAYELGEDGWCQWDSALQSLDRLTPDGRAYALAQL